MIVVCNTSPIIALAAVRPVLDALCTDAGFWIADDLYNAVLKAANEQPDT